MAGLLEANNIYNVKLLVNRVRPDMIQQNDMMSVKDVQVGWGVDAGVLAVRVCGAGAQDSGAEGQVGCERGCGGWRHQGGFPMLFVLHCSWEPPVPRGGFCTSLEAKREASHLIPHPANKCCVRPCCWLGASADCPCCSSTATSASAGPIPSVNGPSSMLMLRPLAPTACPVFPSLQEMLGVPLLGAIPEDQQVSQQVACYTTTRLSPIHPSMCHPRWCQQPMCGAVHIVGALPTVGSCHVMRCRYVELRRWPPRVRNRAPGRFPC